MKAKNITIAIIILIVLIGGMFTYYFLNKSKSPNLLGLENCGGALLSEQEIQSICTSRPQNDTASNLTSYYANKFDNPDYSAGSDTLWNLNPTLIEQCQIYFEEENISGIYLTVFGLESKEVALSNFNKIISTFPKESQIENVSSLGDNAFYSKDYVVGLSMDEKIGTAQDVIFIKNNRQIMIREISQPLSVPLTCTKEQMIKLAQIVQSKIN